ncbi:hypothetical protein KPH14_010556 [Odynerus spinipes]|uniref:Phenoloxidase-activating factor 2 n=1 Tax=Odynerus spinipes TaxID=1348599 RepID=A0AAD9RU59_9HYME|nr:hypothetical protein KPH14_010556 [Odynerus spinipes]
MVGSDSHKPEERFSRSGRDITPFRMKRRLLPILGFVALSLAAPSPQQQDVNLDSLITNVFGPPPSSTTDASKNGNLDSLINELLNSRSNTTTPKTVLGTQNKPTKTADNCECVPYYQCRNGTILENGVGIIDIRVLPGPCENYLDVCCKPPDVVRNQEERVTPRPVPRKGCGQRHPEGVGFRITGADDNEAQFGEFPWMVAILKEETIGNDGQKLNVYQCGGSLIHPKAVLTAAHCVNGKQPSELRVRAGEWDTQTKNEIYPHQDRNVEAIVVHERFHSGALYNDTAVLILSQPVEIAENVDVVCLPDQGAVFDGSRCFASGWGKDVFGKEGHYQVILKKIDLPIVPHDSCQNILRKTRLGKYFTLDSSFICAGGEKGKDTCKGDGGSPLVCPLKNDPKRYVQAGIVAWGIGCGEDTPGIYANIGALRRWIDEQIIYYNLDNTVYQYNP